MNSVFKLFVYLEVLKSAIAIHENPFKLLHLFQKIFEIDSKLSEIKPIKDDNIIIFHEKVSRFHQEIEVASKAAGFEKCILPPNAKGYLGQSWNLEI